MEQKMILLIGIGVVRTLEYMTHMVIDWGSFLGEMSMELCQTKRNGSGCPENVMML